MESLATYPRRMGPLVRSAPLSVTLDGCYQKAKLAPLQRFRPISIEHQSRTSATLGIAKNAIVVPFWCQTKRARWPTRRARDETDACPRRINRWESLISSVTNGTRRSWGWESGAKSPSRPRSTSHLWRMRMRPRLGTSRSQGRLMTNTPQHLISPESPRFEPRSGNPTNVRIGARAALPSSRWYARGTAGASQGRFVSTSLAASLTAVTLTR